MTFTISSGVARRRIGMDLMSRSAYSGSVMIESCTIGVSVKTGHTALIRMLCRTYSKAAVLVMPTTACLLAA